MYVQDIQDSNCRKCSQHKGCTSVCNIASTDDDIEGGLMVVGDFPSMQDDIDGTVMQGTKESIFWDIALNVVRVDPKYVYPTYASKCRTTNGEKPSEPSLLTCASLYITEEVRRIKPKAILLLGSIPMSAFGFNGMVSKFRGTITEWKYKAGGKSHTTKIVIAQSPGFISHNPSELKNFAFDINKAWQVVTGTLEERNSPTRTTMITTLDGVEELIGYIHKTKECVFDFEGTKLTKMNTFDPDFKATLVAFSFQHGSAYTIPLFHFDSPFTEEEVMYILKRLNDEVWYNPEIRKINQNIKFDMHVAARYGCKFRGRLDCTQIMHSLYDSTQKHGIKEWLPNFFPVFRGWELEVKGQQWDKIPLKQLSDYAGVDADGAFRGCTVLESRLLEDPRVYNVYRNLSMFALKVLFRMERRGLLIGRADIIKYQQRAKELLAEQEKKLNGYPTVRTFNAYMKEAVTLEYIEMLRTKRKVAKTEKSRTTYMTKINDIKAGKLSVYKGINYGSPQQLGELLFTKEGFNFRMSYDRKKRMNTKATGADILKNLNDKSGFIQDLRIWRTIKKNLDTYLTGLLKIMDDKDYVHTTFKQATAKTGRLASAEPNVQNITAHIKIKHPFVEEIVGLIKKCFTVPEGYALVNGDFSQAELRMIAELAGETTMIEAYNAGLDLHKITACAIMGLTMEQFNKLPEEEQKAARQKGKSANFGLIYMQSPEGFMEYAKNQYGVPMTLQEAIKIHSAFFIKYPKLREYHAIYIAKAYKFGYVRTMFGRKGHYPDVRSTDEFLRGNAERELVNMPVQGTNGENTVFALSLLNYRLPESVLLVNTVHDNFMAYVPIPLVPYVVSIMKDTAVNLPTLRFFGKEMVKLKMAVDVEISTKTWRDLKPYDEKTWLESVEAL